MSSDGGPHYDPDQLKLAANLLAALQAGTGADPAVLERSIKQFISSENGHVYAEDLFRCHTTALLGEYGYIKRTVHGDQFIRLGSIDEIFGRKASILLHFRHVVDGAVVENIPSPEWPGGLYR